MPRGDGTGPAGGQGRGGRMGGNAAGGPGGECYCPKCGYVEPHKRGVPCAQIRCPQCNTFMVRRA